MSFAVAPYVNAVVAYDLSEAMLNAVAAEASARGITNLTTQQGKAERLPFADASFDFVATRYSAHHWLDVPAALREMRRVLKPGASVMIIDVVAPNDVLCDTFIQSIEMLRDPSHVRDYAVHEWVELLKAAGFAPQETQARRIHIDYASWIARMQTPTVFADAIQALMAKMPDSVRDHFVLERDGSFMLDTASIMAQVV